MHDDGNGLELYKRKSRHVFDCVFWWNCTSHCCHEDSHAFKFGTGHQVTKPQSKVIMLDRCDYGFEDVLMDRC